MRLGAEHTLVVAGFGMAAHALCRRFAEVDRAERPRVIVIGEEPWPAYNRVRLSEAMSGLAASALELSPRAFYAEQGIEVVTGDRVARIDREARRVQTESGAEFAYDALVLATGSEPRRPKVPGIDDPRCFVYRSLGDIDLLSAGLTGARTAAVIGGGLLGLEAAAVLLQRGVQVQVIESGSGLMPRQLDADSGQCLRRQAERLGVAVRASEQITRIEREVGGLVVCFQSGERVAVDLVVVAAGIRPRDELAQAAGLTCSARGGIVVDDGLCTTDPRIFAIGECASHHGTTYGILPPCEQMARVLARRLRGEEAAFARPDLSCRLKLLGVDVAALGEYGKEHAARAVDVDGGRRTLLLEGSRVVGAVVVGSYRELPRLQRAIAEREALTDRQLQRFERGGPLFRDGASLPVTAWPDDAMLCNCAQVRVGDVRVQVAKGVCDVAQVAACTGATSGCGSCKPLLGTLLGDAALAAVRTRTFGLLSISIAAAALVAVSLLAHPIEFASSVSDAFRGIDRLWRDRGLKQITGFSVLGLVALGFVLTVRKRARWPKFGDFNLYRALHAGLGVLTLVGLVAHTGFRLGHNLNFALMASFLAANLIGAAVGLASGLEARPKGVAAVLGRRMRPYATVLHIVLVWPLPVLIGLHVLAVYYF